MYLTAVTLNNNLRRYYTDKTSKQMSLSIIFFSFCFPYKYVFSLYHKASSSSFCNFSFVFKYFSKWHFFYIQSYLTKLFNFFKPFCKNKFSIFKCPRSQIAACFHPTFSFSQKTQLRFFQVKNCFTAKTIFFGYPIIDTIQILQQADLHFFEAAEKNSWHLANKANIFVVKTETKRPIC